MSIEWKRFGETNYVVSSEGKVANGDSGRVLSPIDDGNGYDAVSIYIDKVGAKVKVHRIVAETFIPNPMGLTTVNHINGDKKDNKVSNLEWLSHSDNMKHAWDNGLMLRGSAAPLSVLDEEKVLQIKQLMLIGKSNDEIAKAYGVVRGTISKIRSLETWKHVMPDILMPEAVGGSKQKLTADDIPLIRGMLAKGFSLADVGRKFGVHSGTISGIKSGKAWVNY
jgi:hypothetical protein